MLKNVLLSLEKGGSFVISEDMSRHPIQLIPDLTTLLDVYVDRCPHGTPISFEFYAAKQVEASLFADHNHLDLFWMLTRASTVTEYEEQLATFRDFLDKTQYTEDNVRSYEWIFGENFISPGGITENRRILNKFRTLKPGGKMLDIGVGIGGGARQAANEFGLHVLGVDISTNMIVRAFEKNQREQDCRVRFQIGDIVNYEFPEHEFDYVYSRDVIMHLPDQNKLFAKIYVSLIWNSGSCSTNIILFQKVLKPGGKVVITRYSRGEGEMTPKFVDYVARRHYSLHTQGEEERIAKNAGFVNIMVENITPRFKEILLEEREYTIKNRDKFIAKFSKELYDLHLKGWEDKLGYIADDNHNWHLIYAEKPVSIV